MNIIVLHFVSRAGCVKRTDFVGVFSTEEIANGHIAQLKESLPSYFACGEFEMESVKLNNHMETLKGYEQERMEHYKQMVAEYQDMVNELEADLAERTVL